MQILAKAKYDAGYFWPISPFVLGFTFGIMMPGRRWVACIGIFVGLVASLLSSMALGSEGLHLWPIALSLSLYYSVVGVAGVGAGFLFYRWRTHVD